MGVGRGELRGARLKDVTEVEGSPSLFRASGKQRPSGRDDGDPGTGFLSYFIKVPMELAAKKVVPSSTYPTAVPPPFLTPHLACHFLSLSYLIFLPSTIGIRCN